jgi:hypothetical protein
MVVSLDKEQEQVDPLTFRVPILTLSIVEIQPTIMERLLLAKQLLELRLNLETNLLKIEIETFQLQRLLNPLHKMLIQMQTELLAIM